MYNIDSQCKSQLSAGQCLDYNAQSRTFFASPIHYDERAQEVAQVLKNRLMELNKTGDINSSEAKGLKACAKKFLEREITLHQAELDGGLDTCKNNSFLMNLEAIDRLIIAMKLQKNGSIDTYSSAEAIEELYKTQAAKEQLGKWVNEPTSRAAKHAITGKHPEFSGETIIDRIEGAKAFALHPWQVQFVKEHRLEKQIGTRADKITVSLESKDLCINTEGGLRSIKDIGNELSSERNRLYYEGQRVFYKDKVGLVVCPKDSQDPLRADPEYFQHVVPIFKTNDRRKRQDYRLEVWTVVDHGDHNHGWIGLKDPNGNVRRIGFFRREGEEKPYSNLLETSIGDFHGDGDRYDYMRLEQHIKRTAFTINEDQHNAILEQLLAFQNDEQHRNFNALNQNCIDVVNRCIESTYGFQVPVHASLLDVYLGADIANNFFVKYITPIRLLAFAGCYSLSVLRNLLMLLIGGTFMGEEDKRLFKSFWDIFSPQAGMAHHPEMLRRWQEKVERIREEKINVVTRQYGQSIDSIPQNFPDHIRPIQQNLLEQQRDARIAQIKLEMPEEAKPQQHSFWWYLADMFFSLSDEESIILAP